MLWPRVIIAFFVALAIFNGFLVYFAVSSGNGLVEDSSYDKGLSYQTIIEQTNNAKVYDFKLKITKISQGKYLANLSYQTKSGQNVNFTDSKFRAILPSSKDQVLNFELPNIDPSNAQATFEIQDVSFTKPWLIDISSSIDGKIARWKLKSSLNNF